MQNRQSRETRIEIPPLWHETLAGLDWLALWLSRIYHVVGVPRGDGSPVIVFPGCFASEHSLAELHSWLSKHRLPAVLL